MEEWLSSTKIQESVQIPTIFGDCQYRDKNNLGIRKTSAFLKYIEMKIQTFHYQIFMWSQCRLRLTLEPDAPTKKSKSAPLSACST